MKSPDFVWEAILDNGVAIIGNPRQAALRALPRPVRSFRVKGKGYAFGVEVPLGAQPVVFERHRIFLGTRLGEPEKPRLFVGWERGDQVSLWEFGRGEPRHHDRR